MKTFFIVLLLSCASFAQINNGSGAASLPDQTGNSGKFLTTNGSAASWGTPAGAGDVVAGTFTANFLTKVTNAVTKTIGNSLLSDDGTTLSYTGTGGGSFDHITTTGTAGALVPTAIADVTTANGFWLSSTTANRWKTYVGAATQVFAYQSDGLNVFAAGALANGTAATTQAADDNSTKVATTAYVDRMKVRSITFSFGSPEGSALSTGITRYVTVPFGCTISAYNLLADAGTFTVKFWKVATGTAIPTVSNSISTSGVSLSTGTALHSTTVTDFTATTVTANDIMAANLTAVATAKFVQAQVECDQ